MNEFLKTIYFGDRACKSIAIDCWQRTFKIQATVISRVRGKEWNFYADEDIENGYLVFDDVSQWGMTPVGFLPDDVINYVVAEEASAQGRFSVKLSIDSVNQLTAEHTEVFIEFEARSAHLEDPLKPNEKIL
jgi:hypothetical protein